MKAISIKQPWAQLIAQGLKTLEIRSWKTKYRGPLLICASAKSADFLKAYKKLNHPTRGIWHEDREEGPGSDWENYYQLGKAIAIVELIDIKPFEPSNEQEALCDYAPGLYAWRLKLIEQIEPFNVKGQLNIYNVNYENKKNF